MTEIDRIYVDKQLKIIETKQDEDSLTKYEVLLGAAALDPEIKDILIQTCTRRREILTRPIAMAVNGDIDDIND